MIRKADEWTYGVEYETNAEIKTNGSENILFVCKEKQEAVRVYGDLAKSNDFRTIEIVTQPLFTNSTDGDKYKKIVALLKALFNYIACGSEGGKYLKVENDCVTMEKKDFRGLFDKLKTKVGLDEYHCNLFLEKVTIRKKDDPVTFGSSQLTVGIPLTELCLFEDELKSTPWYKQWECPKKDIKNYYKIVFNIIFSMVEFWEKRISKLDSVSSLGKNEWGIMPRTSANKMMGFVDGLQKMLNEEINKHEELKDSWKTIQEGASLGHKIEEYNFQQVVFEWRKGLPNDYEAEYVFINVAEIDGFTEVEKELDRLYGVEESN